MSGPQQPYPPNPPQQQYAQQQYGQQQQQGFEQQQMKTRPQLTPEEQAVLTECNSESFWYRSLPLGGVLAATAAALVKNGVINGNPRFGAAPKIALGTVFGYFLGKFSYADTCADKFLVKAPRSKISEMVRARRGLPPLEDDVSDQASSSSGLGVPLQPSQPSQEYGYQPEVPVVAPSSGVTNYDELRKRNREVPPQRPPSIAPPPPAQGYGYQAEAPVVTPSTSASGYDELRRRNRENQPAPNYPPQSGPFYPPPPQQTNPSLYIPPTQPKSKNAYGDEGFE